MMLTRIVIHAGPWKTGSSALQEFLGLNRENLISHGILYPLGNIAPQAHHEVPNFFLGTLSRFPQFQEIDASFGALMLDKYFEETIEVKAHTLLLSSEDFAALNSVQYASLFENIVNHLSKNIELIYFDFDAESRLNSHLNQYIRQGEYIDENAANLVLNSVRQITPKFENAINGTGTVLNRIKYEDLNGPENIYERFMHVILGDEVLDGISMWKKPTTGLNVSIPQAHMDKLNEFNRDNLGGREFDQDCPVIYSSKFPLEALRFKMFSELLYSLIHLESLSPKPVLPIK